MPGTTNMLLGGAFLALGTVITWITYAVAPGGYYVVAYGAIIFGGLQFVVGAFQWAGYQLKSSEKKAEHHANIDVRIVVRAMVAVAASDGKLDPSEVVLMRMVTTSIFGAPIDEGVIDQIFKQMTSNPTSFAEEMEGVASQVTPEGAEMAVRAAAMVAMSDGEVSDIEAAKFSAIAASLGVGGERLASCVSSARETINAILRSQSEPRATSATS